MAPIPTGVAPVTAASKTGLATTGRDVLVRAAGGRRQHVLMRCVVWCIEGIFLPSEYA